MELRALRRRITSAVIRRFVASARRSLPRDGPEDILLVRRFVARLARQERRLRRMRSEIETNRSKELPLPLAFRPPVLTHPFPDFMNVEQLSSNKSKQVSRPKQHRAAASGRKAGRRHPATNEKAPLSAGSWTLQLSHVHISVRDLNTSMPFYINKLGLRLTERVGRFAFLTTGNEHHAIALEEIGESAMRPPRNALGLAHIAFEIPNSAAFNAMMNMLRETMIPFISSNNGTNWALDFKDADGNHIQILLDRRNSPGGVRLWEGRWYGPLLAQEIPPPKVTLPITIVAIPGYSPKAIGNP
jgi:catechol 2,3-dioxygenase